MKKNSGKIRIIIMLVMLLLLFSVGTTLAYVFTKTDSVDNTFKPSVVSCAVVENEGTPVTGVVTSTGTVKENVQIKNTGDTEVYIRVALMVNWSSADGAKIWATKPVLGTDYTMTLDLANGWFEGGDGFYYYKNAISPNEQTGILIETATLMEDITVPQGTDKTQYYLSIEVAASAIQATPASTVADQWKVTVDSDGTISK